MSLDAALATIPELEAKLDQVLEQQSEILERLQAVDSGGFKKPVYAYDDLREIGYGEKESQYILRTYGYKQYGPYRVTFGALIDYQEGRPPPSR